MILGNKCDMDDKRVISKEQGERLAKEYGVKFAETSAKANIGVEEAFFMIARSIKEQVAGMMHPYNGRVGFNRTSNLNSPR